MKGFRRRPSATAFAALGIALAIGTIVGAGSSVDALAASRNAINLAPNLTVQDKNLDCEAAALAAAFSVRGVQVNTGALDVQDWIQSQLPVDLRNPIVNDSGITWGDPYTDFVGNVNGVEGFESGDGYGVYYQPIANVVTQVGYTVTAHTGWTTASIEAEIESGSPVVVWIDFRSLASGVGYPTSTWTAFDGRQIPYTLHEHAVTVLGAYPGHSVTLLDVYSGNQYTYTEDQFTAMLSTFGGMGVAVGPKVVVPPAYPVVSALSPAAGPITGGQAVTVTGSGFTPSMTVAIGSTPVTPGNVTATDFTFTTPAAAAGYEQLKVTTAGGSNPLDYGAGYIYTGLAKYVALDAVPHMGHTRRHMCAVHRGETHDGSDAEHPDHGGRGAQKWNGPSARDCDGSCCQCDRGRQHNRWAADHLSRRYRTATRVQLELRSRCDHAQPGDGGTGSSQRE